VGRLLKLPIVAKGNKELPALCAG